MQKTKWLSDEALQIAVKRREAKTKGEKERYKHLNAEFQSLVIVFYNYHLVSSYFST